MTPKICSTCHAPIPESAPGGFCPACLLRDATEPPPVGRAAPSLEEIAAAFPQWEIVRLIGQGGMGFVYQARQPSLDRTVALKILAPELGRDPAFAERFAREARTLGKLHHPNIVTVFEHGESGGYFYLLMEYVDGVNLRQAMRAGRFTPDQALALVPPICDALQAAHAQGVWHRDIKPENILLDTRGGVKIADFGIARLVGDPQRDFTLTMTGGALGSAAYMAPEQHENPRTVDHRADIYSLGVVIYEMLTGELPLGRFPAPSQRAAVNARIDEIVFRTLEKEREMRQQSAEEVKTELENVKSLTPAPPPAVTTQPAPITLWSLGLMLGGVTLFVGSAIFTFGGTQGVSLTLALVAIVIGWIAACLALSGMRHDRISIAWRLGVTLAVWSPGIAAMAMLVVFAMFVSRNPAAQRAALEAAELSPLKAARQSVKTNSTPGSWTVTNSFAGQSSPKTLKLTGEPKQNLTAGTKASCWMVHIDGTPVLLITGQGSTPSSSGASGKGKIKTEIKFRDATLDVSIDGGNEVNINGSVYDLTKGRVMMVGTDGRITQIDRPLDHLLETTEIDNFVSELEAVEVEEVAKLVIKAALEDNHGDLRKLCSRRLLEIVDSDGDPGKNLGMLKRLKFTRILWVKDDLAKAVMVHYAEGREAEFDPTVVREEEVELDFVREDGLWKLAPSS